MTITYQAQFGDSPHSIARKFSVSTPALIAANPHKPTTVVAGRTTWRELRTGEPVVVPTAATGVPPAPAPVLPPAAPLPPTAPAVAPTAVTTPVMDLSQLQPNLLAQHGYRHDRWNRLVDQMGRLVDRWGRHINAQGQLYAAGTIVPPAPPLDGSPVVPPALAPTAVTTPGMDLWLLHDELLAQHGYRRDRWNRMVDSLGRLVDRWGRHIDPWGRQYAEGQTVPTAPPPPPTASGGGIAYLPYQFPGSTPGAVSGANGTVGGVSGSLGQDPTQTFGWTIEIVDPKNVGPLESVQFVTDRATALQVYQASQTAFARWKNVPGGYVNLRGPAPVTGAIGPTCTYVAALRGVTTTGSLPTVTWTIQTSMPGAFREILSGYYGTSDIQMTCSDGTVGAPNGSGTVGGLFQDIARNMQRAEQSVAFDVQRAAQRAQDLWRGGLTDLHRLTDQQLAALGWYRDEGRTFVNRHGIHADRWGRPIGHGVPRPPWGVHGVGVGDAASDAISALIAAGSPCDQGNAQLVCNAQSAMGLAPDGKWGGGTAKAAQAIVQAAPGACKPRPAWWAPRGQVNCTGATAAPTPPQQSGSVSAAAATALAALTNDTNYCTSVGQIGSAVNTAVHNFKLAWNAAHPSNPVPIYTGQYEASVSTALASALGGQTVPSGCAGGAPAPVVAPHPLPAPQPGPAGLPGLPGAPGAPGAPGGPGGGGGGGAPGGGGGGGGGPAAGGGGAGPSGGGPTVIVPAGKEGGISTGAIVAGAVGAVALVGIIAAASMSGKGAAPAGRRGARGAKGRRGAPARKHKGKSVHKRGAAKKKGKR
jgi:hypothetical protein